MNKVKNYWEKWKSIAEKVGAVQAEIVFSLLYYVLTVPLGLIMSPFGDFLEIKKFPVWEKYTSDSDNLNQLRDQ
ncbi:MAG: hypothetical protein UX13_C0023G0005 [Candidatus Woesebacteria bacterium GW2011_GWB1_45_5]|uniref:Uncharacterized protein n=1 Tax=Candidatus Woesebacteria bacterium GW2011_GWB1_45_5 TaxID=1618581 RepID=A0A0G1QMW8_9BACT|nr:MAG: hypothetical protein UX13_C0023G0005 [Candidatus Woesebacteria bacterium GW2011_GWB1_45_5]